MSINWKPGKLEALLLYRGKLATQHNEARRRENGKLAIKLPVNASAEYLAVVTDYKHVGSKTEGLGKCIAESHARASACNANAARVRKFKVFTRA